MGNGKSKQQSPGTIVTQTKKSSVPVVNPDALLSIHFLWTKSHSLYSKMSFNIAREICLYLGRLPELLYYCDHVVYRVNPVQRTTERFFEIDYEFGDSVVDVQAAVFLSKDEVFLLMRDASYSREDYASYAIFKETLRWVQCNAKERLACALLYDPCRLCVYIFGGHGVDNPDLPGSPSPSDSQVGEKFQLSNCSTERLPDMLEPRSAHAVCWHHHCVYICGGTQLSIETFHPESLTYTKVCALPEMVSNGVAFSYQGSLYLLRGLTLWKKTAANLQITAINSREEERTWWSAPYSVAIVGDCCSFIIYDQCATLDLSKLTQTSYTLSPN